NWPPKPKAPTGTRWGPSHRSETCVARGQGRGRTADLPLFRRTLVPTELPARAGGTIPQGAKWAEPVGVRLRGARRLDTPLTSFGALDERGDGHSTDEGVSTSLDRRLRAVELAGGHRGEDTAAEDEDEPGPGEPA